MVSDPDKSSERGGFRLLHLFQLIATLAVLMGLARSGLQQVTFSERYRPRPTWPVETPPTPPAGQVWVDHQILAAVAVAAAILGGVIGLTSGVIWFRSLRGLIFGVLVGAIAGGSAGVLGVCPPSMQALAICCTVLIAVAALLRLATD